MPPVARCGAGRRNGADGRRPAGVRARPRGDHHPRLDLAALLLALVVWMTVQARRRRRAWLLYPVFGVLALTAVGGAYETLYSATDSAVALPAGHRLVDVGGYRLDIRCTGTSSPTVVLEPGLGESATAMARWIAPAVAPHHPGLRLRAGRSRPQRPGPREPRRGLARSARPAGAQPHPRALRHRRTLTRGHVRAQLRPPVPLPGRRRRPARLDASAPVQPIRRRGPRTGRAPHPRRHRDRAVVRRCQGRCTWSANARIRLQAVASGDLTYGSNYSSSSTHGIVASQDLVPEDTCLAPLALARSGYCLVERRTAA